VEDHQAGKPATCAHCHHHLTVPKAAETVDEPPLRLRPLEAEEPPRVTDHLLRPPTPLTVRPAESDPVQRPAAISDPDAPPVHHGRHHEGSPYVVLEPRGEGRGDSGPPSDLELVPIRIARFIARSLRTLRDWLYLISIAALVLVLIGYLFSLKLLLHIGAVVVIAANISMLTVGLAYLVSLPFKEGLRYGLANLLVPFYAVYYWWTRWPKMKPAVVNTFRAFAPILLVGFAYLVFEEAPVIEQKVEQEFHELEKAVETKLPSVEQQLPAVESIEKKLDTPEEKR
jgi:hypothetical protein